MTSDDRDRRFPTGIIAAGTFLVGVLVLFLLFRSENDGTPNPARVDFDTEAFEDRVAKRLDPVVLRPVSALRVRVSDLEWRDPTGRPFLAMPTATFRLELPGPGQPLVLSGGILTRPNVRLVRSEGGQWNYERPLAPLFEGSSGQGRGVGGSGSGLAIVLRDMVVRDGLVTVDLPQGDFAARGLEVRLASGRLSGPGVDAPTFDIASASAMLELPDTAAGTIVRAVSVEDARLRLLDGALAFDVAGGTFGSSAFADASGIWSPQLGGLGLDAELRASNFRIADLPWLRAEVPADATGSFHLRIEPFGNDRTAVALSGLTLTAPGSSATGSLRAVFGAGGLSLEAIDMRVDPLALSLVEAFTGPLPYTGDLRGTLTGSGGAIAFDLTANLATSLTAVPFRTDLAGQVSFTSSGLDLERVTATLVDVPLAALEPLVPGLPLAGPVSGTVTLAGMPSEEPIQLDVRLEAGGGVVTVAGAVDLSGPVPTYDLGGRLVGVELRAVMAPAMPPARIHADFDLQGSGTELATADARVRLNGTFTGWRSEAGDTIALQGSLAGGRLDLDAGRLELGPVALTAAGEWALVGEGGGAITYELQVASLEPLAPYLPPDAVGRARFARGSLQAAGTLSGTLEAPTLAGSIQASDFRFGEWAAEQLEGEYTANMSGSGFPTVEAQVSGTDIRTPSGDFETLGLSVDFTRPNFALAFRADQVGGGVLEIEAGGRIEEAGGREVELRVVEVDLEDQRWRLPSPATVAWTRGDAIAVEGLTLQQVDGEGLLRLDGIVAPFDDADLAIEARDLPVGDILDLVGMDLGLAGVLSLNGQIRGPADAPFLTLDASLTEGTIRDVAVRNITTAIRYEGAQLTLDGTGIIGDSAFVELEGMIPGRMTLGLPPSFELEEGREIAVHLVTNDFPLATLDPGIRSVQDLEGLVRADVRIGGTPDQPRLTGSVDLVEGAVTVPMLDKRYTEIQGTATLAGRELVVQRMVASAGGTATLSGRITFEDLTDPALDLTAELQGFEAQGVPNASDAGATGRLRLSGTVTAPVVSGRVVMDDGTVSLAPFTGGPRLSDRLVGVAEEFAPIASDDLDLPGAETPFVRVTDLQFVAGDDLWFATEEARAQLRGTLNLETVGSDLTLTGTLVGEQGTFNMRVGPVARQFNIVAANIRFLGSPEPNPALDITASRRVPLIEGGVVDVRVRVTGNLSNPQLGLSSADGVAVGESELLSLVLFGRQSYTAADPLGGQNLFAEAFAFAGIFDWGSAWLGEADVLEGLDQFQIQMRPGSGGFEGAGDLWVVLGEQLGDEWLVTFETPLRQSDLWILAAEWRIDREWTLELSYEPESYIGAVGAGRLPAPLGDLAIDQQLLGVIRWRWTY